MYRSLRHIALLMLMLLPLAGIASGDCCAGAQTTEPQPAQGAEAVSQAAAPDTVAACCGAECDCGAQCECCIAAPTPKADVAAMPGKDRWQPSVQAFDRPAKAAARSLIITEARGLAARAPPGVDAAQMRARIQVRLL